MTPQRPDIHTERKMAPASHVSAGANTPLLSVSLVVVIRRPSITRQHRHSLGGLMVVMPTVSGASSQQPVISSLQLVGGHVVSQPATEPARQRRVTMERHRPMSLHTRTHTHTHRHTY